MKIDPTSGGRVTAIAGEQLETLASAVDVVRLEGLLHAQTVATAQASALRQERARLVAKYGADAPQVALADARITAQDGVVTRLRADVERAETPPPEIGGNVAIVYGRVVDDDGAGLRGYTVSVLDARGAVRGSADSGERGAFQIGLEPVILAREAPRKRRQAVQAAATTTSASETTGGTTDTTSDQAVTLEVSNGKQVVARSAEPIELLPGTAAYVELKVRADAPSPASGTR